MTDFREWENIFLLETLEKVEKGEIVPQKQDDSLMLLCENA